MLKAIFFIFVKMIKLHLGIYYKYSNKTKFGFYYLLVKSRYESFLMELKLYTFRIRMLCGCRGT